MCLVSSAIRKIITKTALRILLAPVRVTVNKKTMTTKAGKDVEKGEPLFTAGGNLSLCSHYRNQHQRSIKKKSRKRAFIRLSYATPGHVPKDSKSTHYRDAAYP